MALRYSLSDYDQHCSLKPPWLLWFAVLYLSRAVTLPLLARAGSSLAGISDEATEFVLGLFTVYTLLPSAIAVVVLYALLRRVPTASGATRWVWHRGRAILAFAAVLDGALSLSTSLWRAAPAATPGGALLVPAMDLYLLVYLYSARRVRDAFADFPAPPQAAKPATNGPSAARDDA